ncbi:MAG: L-fucose mutarotase [Phycisphaerales bacterium]|nr:L-fucose mutarotase [Phycisphaerales bacterium]
MLMGIPAILSPELLKILMEMGHGDEIVFADGNFPAASVAKRLVRLDGHGILPLLEAVLRFFPLDTFVDKPVALMAVVPGDAYKPVIQDAYRDIIGRYVREGAVGVECMDRFAFYERARAAYAVVATGEIARYANILLKKGIVEAPSSPGKTGG